MRTRSLIGCGAVVDMRSGAGQLLVVDNNNTILTTITTDPAFTGHPYVDVVIPDDCVCQITGNTALLLYHKKRQSAPLPEKATNDTIPSSSTSPYDRLAPDIVVRIQISRSGRLSLPYHKDVMRPEVTSEEFFNWFQKEIKQAQLNFSSLQRSRFTLPLTQLSFVLKDSMPVPKTGIINRGDEATFDYVRRYIEAHFEKAKSYCPGLREFAVLLMIPGPMKPEVASERS